MVWTELNFGKHTGKTLPQVLFIDPDWFFWAYEKKTFGKYGLSNEAEKIYKLATRLPVSDGEVGAEQCEYWFSLNGKFSHFIIVEKDRADHTGASRTIRKDYIDMSFLRSQRGYDKSGYESFINCLKKHYFVNPPTRFTRSVCEDFFAQFCDCIYE